MRMRMRTPSITQKLSALSKKSVHCLFQMVPIVKKSTDTLVEKLGEFAESGRSVDVSR